jgi:hypothetical protein
LGRDAPIFDPQRHETRTIQPERKFIANPEAAQAERRDLVARLENGFQRVQQTEEFRKYLDTVARFHKYSVANTILIWMQRPDATHVAGFHTWLSLGRRVRRGEKGIRIFAPIKHRRTNTISSGTADDSGEDEISQLRFRAVSVFESVNLIQRIEVLGRLKSSLKPDLSGSPKKQESVDPTRFDDASTTPPDAQSCGPSPSSLVPFVIAACSRASI